jgi:hypothetical protein
MQARSILRNRLRMFDTPPSLNPIDHFIDGDFLFRSDRLERLFEAASYIGNAHEQKSLDLRRQIQKVADQHRGNRVS